MLFNFVELIFLFLPVAVLVYHALAGLKTFLAQVWLWLASFIFYGYWNVSFVALLAASIAFNFFSGLCIDALGKRPRSRTAVLVAAIACNLLVLFYYKYVPTLAGIK